MRILIIGGHGTIGRKVNAHLSLKNEILVAGRTTEDIIVDISDANAIVEMFERR